MPQLGVFWKQVVDWSYRNHKGKTKFLHKPMSSPKDCSKHYPLHSLADLFSQTPSSLLQEVFSHTEITDDCLFTYPLQEGAYTAG